MTAAQKRLYEEAKRQGPTSHIKARMDTVMALYRAGYIEYKYTGKGNFFIKIIK